MYEEEKRKARLYTDDTIIYGTISKVIDKSNSRMPDYVMI